MVEATCNNEDCPKDTWALTKHPSDYSRGVSCPECGTTRVDYDEPREKTDGPDRGERNPRREEQEPRERRGGEIERREPERRERQPARQEDNGLSTAEGLIAAVDSDAPADVKKKGVESVGRGLIGLVKSAISYNSKKERMAEERARNADLQQTNDKPGCECGYVFTNIGVSQDRVQCPECGTEYEVIPQN